MQSPEAHLSTGCLLSEIVISARMGRKAFHETTQTVFTQRIS